MKIFQKVHCRAYMAKAHEYVRIQLFNADGTFCEGKSVDDYKARAIAYKYDSEKNEEVEIADLSEFDGGCVEKTYRERIEKDFCGVLVGFTKINVKGRIGTDWECIPDCGFGSYREYGHCFKEITDRAKVGVVYFKNNCKRYVLTEDMESME